MLLLVSAFAGMVSFIGVDTVARVFTSGSAFLSLLLLLLLIGFISLPLAYKESERKNGGGGKNGSRGSRRYNSRRRSPPRKRRRHTRV